MSLSQDEHRWIVEWFNHQLQDALDHGSIRFCDWYGNLYGSNRYYLSNEGGERRVCHLSGKPVLGFKEELEKQMRKTDRTEFY